MPDDFTLWDNIKDLIGQFIAFVPRFVGAILILIIGWIIAKIIKRVVRKILKKTGVDRLAAQLNQIEMIEKANLKIEFSTILATVFYYLLMLVFIIMATETLGMEVVSNLISDLFDLIPLLLSAAIILVLGIILADILRKVVLTTCRSLGIPSAKIISSFVFYFILINIAISALAQASVDTQFLASNISIILGGAMLAFGIGYGLASKTLFADLITSFYHKNKFQIGQTITFKEQKGKITQITKTSIVLETNEGSVVIPLHKLTEEEIIIHN